jgi:hypothetical protein
MRLFTFVVIALSFLIGAMFPAMAYDRGDSRADGFKTTYSPSGGPLHRSDWMVYSADGSTLIGRLDGKGNYTPVEVDGVVWDVDPATARARKNEILAQQLKINKAAAKAAKVQAKAAKAKKAEKARRDADRARDRANRKDRKEARAEARARDRRDARN